MDSLKDLLKEGVDIKKSDYSPEYVKQLEELGFGSLGVKKERIKEFNCLVISEKKISDYLTRCYEHNYPLHNQLWFDISKDNLTIRGWGRKKRFEDTHLIESRWREVNITEVQEVPPINVLPALKTWKERNVFDYYTIATVKVEKAPLRDPFLLGRIIGDSNRYFIAQWGDDHIDDVI